MKIIINKQSPHRSAYTIIRHDGTSEQVVLDTKTYLVHDICHYVVEKQLEFDKGFWGMLSNGYSFDELSGKQNPLTEELRFIEQIVGPIQSTYLGNIPNEKFEMFIEHLDVAISIDQLNSILEEIRQLLQQWQHLNIGEEMQLQFDNVAI